MNKMANANARQTEGLRAMINAELTKNLMTIIKARKTSYLLRTLAEKCREERESLMEDSRNNADEISYLSDEENIFIASSRLFEQAEQNNRSK